METKKIEFRYKPQYCAILGKHVWAICTKHAEGRWRIVNCLDKDEGCFSLECAFTTDHGEWPYPKPSPEAEPQVSPQPPPA